MTSKADGRLSTWAEIADYIGRDERTARRYEAERGLPVRRLPGSRSTVYALTRDLDAWRTGERPAPEAAVPTRVAAPQVGAARRARPVIIVLTGVALAAAAAAGVAWLPRTRPATRDETSVVMAALQNDAGDATLDRLVPSLLKIELTQSPRLQVMGDARVGEALALMERPRDAALVPSLAREVCVRGNGGVLVAPGVARLGARYVLTAVASDCVSGRVLSEDEEAVAGKDDLLGAVQRLAARTRRRLGESRASVSRFALPLRAARTASFDALRAYSEAAWLSERGKDGEATPLFRRAIELDGGFGPAWLGLAQAYYRTRQWREDAEAMVHAYGLRASMSERDQLFTAYRYHYVVERDFVAAQASLKALASIYAHDATILSALSFVQLDLGEYDQAIVSAEQAVRADGRSTLARTNLMRALIRAGQPARARTEGDAAIRAGLMDGRLVTMRILAAAQGGDMPEARRLLQATSGTPLERDALLQYASLLFGTGQARNFDAMVDQADVLGRRQGLRMDWVVVAAALADMGADAPTRRRLAQVEPDLRSGRYLRAVALVGDPARAEADLAQDQARWPNDTLRNAEYGPEARAILLLRRGDAPGAVRAMSGPDPFEFRTLEFPYIRAVVLLAAGDGPAATAAFRSVLAHPGWSNWGQYPLSHLGLARALRLQGDVAGARREYDAFLAAWRDADPDMLQLKAARDARSTLPLA